MVELNEATLVPGIHERNVSTAIVALGTDEEQAVWRNNTGKAVTMSRFGFTPDAAATGNDTNNYTLQGKVKTAAGGAAADLTAVKTYKTGVDLVAWVEEALTLSTTVADTVVEDGELVTIAKVEAGSGLALPAGVVSIEFKYN